MNIKRASENEKQEIVTMIIAFREALKTYKSHGKQTTYEKAVHAYQTFVDKKYMLYVAEDKGVIKGYIFLKVDTPCVWVEMLFVKRQYRRTGVADALFDQAESIATSNGEQTVYNNIHPNNQAMICFFKNVDMTCLIRLKSERHFQKNQT